MLYDFRAFFIVFLTGFFFSCGSSVEGSRGSESTSTRIESTLIQEILDSAHLKGAVLIYDEEKSRYYSNDFEWASTGHLPASTFKIPNSIVALESGVVEGLTSVFLWDGNERSFKVWERDLTFKEAFQVSCVPCYQEIARKVGFGTMRTYLDTLDFGEMRFDTATLDQFWLQGQSRISQFEEIDFLVRLVHGRLPILERTVVLLKEMMLIEDNPSYALRGKTGWSISNETNNGWFVGYLEANNSRFFIATNVEPCPNFDMDKFAKVRIEVTIAALRGLAFL
ncbi:UNVERIFIED_CONTAM: hypothetical protein GTU68_008362 [Idotea baltica]|nr:hypothetical protein [Idotea baltica]